MAAPIDAQVALEPQPDIAREFLAYLDDIHLVAILPDGKPKLNRDDETHGRHFGKDIEAAIKWASNWNGVGRGIYWTCNGVPSGLHKKPSKKLISHARFAHCDIDPVKGGPPLDKSAVLSHLDTLSLPPSFIIDSGGGLQPVWRLDEAIENWQNIETINLGIREQFHGDACHNIDRLLRLPGFINWPTELKRNSGRRASIATIAQNDDGVVYRPEQLLAAFPITKERAAGPKSANIDPQIEIDPNVTMHTPLSIGASADLTKLIQGPMPSRYLNDRSRWGNGVAWSLAKFGSADTEIIGILLNPENECSQHYLDQADPYRAASNSIRSARTVYPNARSTAAFDNDGEAEPEEEESLATTRPEPEWYRSLGNDAFAEYIHAVLDSSPERQPELALASAIATFGILAGRRYEGPTGYKTNFYILGLAESSTGKDHPLKSCGRFLDACGLPQLRGGNKIASEQGMLAALEVNPRQLYTIDEAHSLMQAMLNKKGQQYERLIATRLTELFTSAGDRFNGVDRREGRSKAIQHPHLCFYGTCPKSTLFDGSISPEEFSSGMLPRFLIFQGDNHPEIGDDDAKIRFSPSLINTAKAINKIKGGIFDNPEAVPVYKVATETSSAKEFRLDLRTEARATRSRYIDHNPALASIYGRRTEHTAKLALTRAVVANPTKPQITLDMMQWGYGIAERNSERLADLLDNHSSYNDHDACTNLIIHLLSKAGKSGLTRARLNNTGKMRDYAAIREKVALELVVSEMISLKEKPSGPKGGAPGKVYVLAKYK